MANYANSVLVTAQALLLDKFSKPEMRHKDYTLIKLMLAGRPAFDTDINVMKTSDGRAVEAYSLTKAASDAVTARAHNHTAAANGDSQKISLSWTTAGQKFKMSLKQGDNNVFNNAQMLANRMESAWIHTLDTIEAALASWLNTYKSQVQSASNGELGEWDAAAYIWQIANSNKNWFFQYVESMMALNNYSGMVDIVADPVMFAVGKQLMAQGAANATNTSFQFGDSNIVRSTSLAALTNYVGYCYAIPQGTVAVETWVPQANRQNVRTDIYNYTTMADPFGLGLTAALHSYEAGADTSSTGGATQDVTTQYELTMDYSPMKAPLSTANESTIFKSGLLQ